VVTSISTLFVHLSKQNALTEATPVSDIHPDESFKFQDFLKQKSRGNHYAIGFYFVKSEL
jgi:hypothetical protein